MAGRVLVSASMALCRSHKHHHLKNLLLNHTIFTPWCHKSIIRRLSFRDIVGSIFGRGHDFGDVKWIHSGPFLNKVGKSVEQPKHFRNGASPSKHSRNGASPPKHSRNGAGPPKHSRNGAGPPKHSRNGASPPKHSRNGASPPKHSRNEATVVDSNGDEKVKRTKPKGKRAMLKWLKFFRWKKKKEFQRMTAEEKILYKLKKARNKEERLVTALKKVEPAESSETTHDPEMLTPEEHHFFLKMGLKCKNYVPVGRRGIYQGVILNMHLHWKKHQTLQVIVKTFSPDEVKEIATELARLTGGIVLDIHDENKIIMYRGKNYAQPPTEIMSPRVTLSRKKALDKSIYRDGLRAVRKYIPRLEQEMLLLQEQATRNADVAIEEIQRTTNTVREGSKGISNLQLEKSDKLKVVTEDETMLTDSEENLSDVFETDSETEPEEKIKPPLYLENFDKFPVETIRGEAEDRNARSLGEGAGLPNLDEVDRMFLQAESFLKRKRR